VTNQSQRCGGNDLETPRKAIFEVGGGYRKAYHQRQNLVPGGRFLLSMEEGGMTC
jgi:hypothetical protein